MRDRKRFLTTLGVGGGASLRVTEAPTFAESRHARGPVRLTRLVHVTPDARVVALATKRAARRDGSLSFVWGFLAGAGTVAGLVGAVLLWP